MVVFRVCVCVRCQLLEAGWRLSAGIVFSVCYMREHDGYLSVTWGRLAFAVSYVRQDGGCL